MSKCRACGCTDDRACLGGCWWVEPDLCSACDRGDRLLAVIEDEAVPDEWEGFPIA